MQSFLARLTPQLSDATCTSQEIFKAFFPVAISQRRTATSQKNWAQLHRKTAPPSAFGGDQMGARAAERLVDQAARIRDAVSTASTSATGNTAGCGPAASSPPLWRMMRNTLSGMRWLWIALPVPILA